MITQLLIQLINHLNPFLVCFVAQMSQIFEILFSSLRDCSIKALRCFLALNSALKLLFFLSPRFNVLVSLFTFALASDLLRLSVF